MGLPAPNGVSASGLPPLGDKANAVVSGVLSAVGPGKPFAFFGPINVAIWASVVDQLTSTHGSAAAVFASGAALAVGASVNSPNVPRGTTVLTLAAPNGTLAFPTLTYPVREISTASRRVTLPAGSNVNALLGATVTVPSNAEGVTIPAATVVSLIVQADIAPTVDSPGQVGIIELSAAPTAVPTTNPLVKAIPLEFKVTANAVTTGVDAAASYTGAGIVYVGTVQLERSFDGGATWLIANLGGDGTLAQYAAGTPVNLSFGEPEREVLYRLNVIAYTSGNINYRMSATGPAATSLSVSTLG